jgi:xanthine dehydrogenase molybdopterin-binding subunit B
VDVTIETGVRLRGRIIHADSAPGRITALSLPVEMPGGASLTGKQALDLHPYFGPVVHDQPLLAIDRVRYRGEPVAVIAAPSLLEPSTLTLTTEPLSPVATGAKRGDAPLVHVIDLLERAPLAGGSALNTARTNRLMRIEHTGQAAGAPVIRDRVISIAQPLAAPDAPVAAAASWQDDEFTVWTVASDHAEVRRELAEITGLDSERIQLLLFDRFSETHPLPGAIGVEALAVAIARRARQPVEIVATRRDFTWSGPRAMLTWDERGNLSLVVDAGAVMGYLPLWLDEFARLATERTAAGATVTTDLVYSEQPPVAASKAEWIAALTGALDTEAR